MKKYIKATYIQKRNGKKFVCHHKEVYTEQELADHLAHQRMLMSMRNWVRREEYNTERLITLSETYDNIDPNTLGGVMDAYEEYRQNVLDCDW